MFYAFIYAIVGNFLGNRLPKTGRKVRSTSLSMKDAFLFCNCCLVKLEEFS